MAEMITIARPYAEAVFKLAIEKNAAPQWSGMLALMATIARDPDMANLAGNPKVDRAQLSQIFESICEGRLDEDARQLIRLLVENHRITALPAIRDQFEALRHQHEGILDAQITSAFSITGPELDALVNGLEKRFGRKIRAEVTVDASLIGGVKVTVGDLVIDGSVRARIDQMAIAIKR